jgi:hypothetical protein
MPPLSKSALAKIQRSQDKRLAKIRKRASEDLRKNARTEERLAQLDNITDEDWEEALLQAATAEPPEPPERGADWRVIVAAMLLLYRLVHQAARQEEEYTKSLQAELLRERIRFYEDELTVQAARVGCPGRKGHLTNEAIRGELNELCRRDAESIANTYNRDLAAAIARIGKDAPGASRAEFRQRLEAWESKRASWKNPQIALYTEMSARSLAQQHFYERNHITGTAVLRPERAVCPVCIGWVQRGPVPLDEAERHPAPYHVNCPHYWLTMPNKVAPERCSELWMGE